MSNLINPQAKILVADDQPTNRELAIFFLKNAGYQNFIEASSGQETLELTLTHKPDIILLDILMPEPNGFEVCKALKANSETANIPVLFLSGLTDIKNRTLGYQLGALDYVHKPIDRHEMCARVTTHLNNSLLKTSLQEYKNRVSLELQQAKELQLSLLPQSEHTQAAEEVFPVKISHHFASSSELSGDYWGLFPGKERLNIISLDFTGHGVAAAMNSLRAHALLLELQELFDQPIGFMQALNQRLHKLLTPGHFATCGLISIAPNGEAFVLGAGMPPIAHHQASKNEYQWLTANGTPLGSKPNDRLQLSSHEIKLAPHDSLILYSDALLEAAHQNKPMWGTKGLQDTWTKLAKNKGHQPVKDICEAFYNSAITPLTDDLTLVGVEFTG